MNCQALYVEVHRKSKRDKMTLPYCAHTIMNTLKRPLNTIT